MGYISTGTFKTERFIYYYIYKHIYLYTYTTTMPQKMIYLSDELFTESKSVTNFSELIQNLFKDYLQTKKTKKQLLNEAEKITEETKKIVDEKNKEIDKIIIEVKKVESEEEISKKAAEERQHKLANKINACVEETKNLFDVVISEKEAEEYLIGNFNTIKEYLISINKWWK